MIKFIFFAMMFSGATHAVVFADSFEDDLPLTGCGLWSDVYVGGSRIGKMVAASVADGDQYSLFIDSHFVGRLSQADCKNNAIFVHGVDIAEDGELGMLAIDTDETGTDICELLRAC